MLTSGSASVMLQQLQGTNFAKGYSTGKDFVVITDPDGTVELTAEHVAVLCNRQFGIGAEGVIRVVRSTELPEGRQILEGDGTAEWFMDCRHHDGSLVQLNENSVRVFTHSLVQSGLIELAAGAHVTIGTRDGPCTVHGTDSGYAIDMGPWSYVDEELARERASDSLVLAAGLADPRPALSITVSGDAHTVVAMSPEEDLGVLDLNETPRVDPTPRDGTHVGFVVPTEPLVTDGIGRLRLRVYERTVGETLGSGTSVCAAAAAVRTWAGPEGSDSWLVDMPGGTLQADFLPHEAGTERIILSGPAELVYTGTII